MSKSTNPLQSKLVYDVILPFLIAANGTIIFYFFKDTTSITGENGIMEEVKGFLPLLVAFFIASLAAVSTFNNADLDNHLSGQPAMLKLRINNEIRDYTLTRRQFVCYLFGYLSFITIFLSIFISLIQGFALDVYLFILNCPLTWLDINIIRLVTMFIFLFVCGNLLITTLLGLYFLTAGFHKPK